METGKNSASPLIKQLIFEGRKREEMQSIGLSFEPNFFTTWYYATVSGEDCIGCEKQSAGSPPLVQADTPPLYGIVHSEAFTLVPDSLFDEGDASKYLALSTSFPDQGQPSVDVLPELSMAVVYQDTSGAQTYADTHYPGLKVYHITSHLMRIFARLARPQGQQYYIYGTGNLYVVLAYQHGELLLANAMEAHHTDDLVYYLLYAMKQFKAPASSPTALLGDAEGLDSLYSTLKPYLTSLTVGVNPSLLELQVPQEELARHFIGLTGPLCA